eukprot:CAMPEP_0197896852 /NCGR_PEP_ID=MMETSP1439-20131203/40948_1 /TAXON_ID=66791 /ORGANISM="Gonyaulax spinifera, Strain CCMP409" /LENGTH=59 /DNA_ID=CAMNT_0043517423 /DNA_START=15 /DNA_END=190 /DNA_ORIENTATION=-
MSAPACHGASRIRAQWAAPRLLSLGWPCTLPAAANGVSSSEHQLRIGRAGKDEVIMSRV